MHEFDKLDENFKNLLAKIDREAAQNRAALIAMMQGLKRLKTLFEEYDPEETQELELSR